MKARLILILTFLLAGFFSPITAQNYIWARQYNLYYTNSYAGTVVATDHEGNTYMAGGYNDSLEIESTIYVSSSTGAFYMAKINPAGKVVWSVHNSAKIYYLNMSYDFSGFLYVTGNFSETATFDTVTLTSPVNMNTTFVAKYDTAGNFIWVKAVNVSDYTNSPYSHPLVTAVQGGNFLLYGSILANSVIDTIPVYTSNGHVYLAEFNAAGNVLWVKQLGIDIEFFKADQLNNLIVCSSRMPGDTVIYGNDTLINAGLNDNLILKLDPNGNALWARSIGTASPEGLYGLSLDAADNIYVAGRIGDTTQGPWQSGNFPFIYKFNSSGNIDWIKYTTNDSHSNDEIRTMAGDEKGNSYYFHYLLDTANITSSNPNGFTSHFVKTDSSGVDHWDYICDELLATRSTLHTAANGNVVVLGGKEPNLNYHNLHLGNCELTNRNDGFIFVAMVHDTNYTTLSNNVIQGNIFNDTNLNCIKEPGENILQNYSVMALPGPYYSSTDSNGNYTMQVDTGNYVISEIFPANPIIFFSQVCPAGNSYPVSLSGNNNILNGNDFANSVSGCQLISVSGPNAIDVIFCNPAGALNDVVIWNHGADTVHNIQLVIKYPAYMLPVSSSIPWNSFNTTDTTLTFLFSDLLPDSSIQFSILDSVDCNGPVNIWDVFHYSMTVTPMNTCLPEDTLWNHDSYALVLLVPIGLQANETKDECRIYPVPFRDELHLVVKDKTEVTATVYDVTARKIMEEKFKGMATLNTSSLGKGVFVYEVRNENHTISRGKIIKN